MDAGNASANKALIRRWFEEVWNEGREELIEEMRAPDTVATGLAEGGAQLKGPEPFRAFFSNLRATLPDLHVKIEDLLAEADKVVARLSIEGTHLGDALGVPATGQRVQFSGICIARISGGRIVESWNNLDQMGLMMQIGAIPASRVSERFLTKPR